MLIYHFYCTSFRKLIIFYIIHCICATLHKIKIQLLDSQLGNKVIEYTISHETALVALAWVQI